MSTPVGKGGRASCCVSGCTEPRLQRNYCARHHNATLGKAERPLRAKQDLEPAVQWLFEGITKGVDAMHHHSSASSAAAAAPAAIPVSSGSATSRSTGTPEKAGSGSSGSGAAPPVNAYLQLLTPLVERLLENIRNPASAQPLSGSSLDIFSFSAVTAPAAAAAAAAPGKGASPARPPSALSGESEQPAAAASGSVPPSPADLAASALSSVSLSAAAPLPIVDIKVQISKPQAKNIPSGFELLERSISGLYPADLNARGNGKAVMLMYQRGGAAEEEANVAANQNTASSTRSSTNDATTGTSSSPSTNGVTTPSLSSQYPHPITSLSVIFRDACEEPPFGFVCLDKTVGGQDANLNHHGSSSAPGRQVYLCVHRGEGAPIADLGVVFQEKREVLPAGFHAVTHTPFGNRADLNAALNAQPLDAQQAAGSSAQQQQQSQAVYVCFRPHVTPVLQGYLSLLADPTGAADSASRGLLLHAKVLALLTACLYSADQKMVLHALEGFMKIPPESIPPLLLNRFLQAVCDAAPCFQTYFTTQAHTALLKFLLHAFKTFCPVLSMDSLAKVLEVCFLTRHEDKQGEVSEKIVAALLDKIERAKPCKCLLREQRHAGDQAPFQVNMHAVAGGEGHSKPSNGAHHKRPVGGSSSSSGAGTGVGAMAGAGSSAAAAASPASSSTLDGAAAPSPPLLSSSLCHKCRWQDAFSNAPPAIYCREVALQLAQRVFVAKELEADVKTFQRHQVSSSGGAAGSGGPGSGTTGGTGTQSNSNAQFRTDVAKIVASLFQVDQQDLAHIEKNAPAAAAATAAAASAAAAAFPPGGISPFSGSVVEPSSPSAAAVAPSSSPSSPSVGPRPPPGRPPSAKPLTVNSAAGATEGDIASPTAHVAQPLTTSAASAAIPFAFDEVLVGGGVAAEASLRHKRQEKDRVVLPQKEERFLCVAALVCAKFASEGVQFGLLKSEQIKRKTHALRLLFYILHHGVHFFRATPGGQLLVRRFLCPALMSVCVTDSALLWRLLLQTFTVLYEQYRSFLMIELGAWFDHVLLPLLESPWASFELKKDILDMWQHILSRPEALVQLFYNYDNSHKNWNIFERLNTVLARITEGEQKSFVPLQLHAPSSSTSASSSSAGTSGSSSGSSAGVTSASTSGSSATADQRAEYIEQQEDLLQRQALRLLVHNLHMLAQWVGVPGCKRSPDLASQPLINDDDMPDPESDEAAAAAGGDTAATAASASSSSSIVNSKSAAARLSKLHRGSRIDTWSWRHDKQKADAKILAESLKLARTEKLKSALQYLRIVDPAMANPKAIAHFLFSHEGLDKAEVGDFLGAGGDKFMSDAEHEDLRRAFIEHLDFTGMLFDQSLRLFLCDSGFRLPGEAQKIDRLLEAFCRAYCRDNPAVFRHSSSAFVVAFALVMLNTDLHDARLRSGTSSRQPMTEAQFISNLRGVDKDSSGKEHDFPRAFLESLYRNIAAQAIEWKEKKGADQAAVAAAEERARDNQTDLERSEDQAKTVRKTYELCLRRALAYLKNWAAYDQACTRTSNTLIVAAMFEVSWYRIISAITLRSDNYRPGDVELLQVCLDGLAYGSSIAIALGLPTERQAFSRQLAKLTFTERNRESNKANNMRLRLVQGEHLKQEWYRPFNLMCEKSPARACRVVFDVAHDLKQKINYERRQARLSAIETDFAHEIVLVDPNRSFVREGPLLKFAASSAAKKAAAWQKRHFMLFNDLLLYASEGINSKWKCHRVIHLSLCRVEDLRGVAYESMHAFRIVSPQKSITLSAPSKEKKQAWLQAIVHHLEQVMAKRRRYIEEARAQAAGGGAGMVASPLSPASEGGANDGELVQRGLSTFIGNGARQSDYDLARFNRQDSASSGFGMGSGSNLDTTGSQGGSGSGIGSASATPKPPPNHCKLCIRPWAMFRRKQKCRWCADLVCSDCCAQKCFVPNGPKRLLNVCDACFGVIKGMVGDNVKLLTVCDT